MSLRLDIEGLEVSTFETTAATSTATDTVMADPGFAIAGPGGGYCCTGCVSGCGINPTASGCASGGGGFTIAEPAVY